MNYKKAKELFETCRNKETGKPLENNTRLVKTERGYGVKLHNTIVVEYLPNGDTVVNSGGWRTVTTKDRINRYGVKRIYQEKGIWYVDKGVFFTDGMVFKADGTIKKS